jgi:YidC/Oxa1 family membrane protein insertase
LDIWKLIIQQPLINILIVMSHYLGNFGVAIIVLTILINLLMLPLTLSQIRSSKAMQDLQPKLADIQKKFGKDRARLAKEQMALYKTAGVKPAGCAVGLVVQMPIWIALYQAIILALAVAPEGLLSLSRYMYSWDVVYKALPLGNSFLGMDLGTSNFILAFLVGATMWVQQKMSMTTISSDPKQSSQTQMMLWMMPLMFGIISLSVPAGLSLYWAANSIARIFLQYRITGWGGLVKQPSQAAPGQKYLKFDATVDKKSEPDTGADIVVTDSVDVEKPLKPKKSRYQPGKERQQRRRKKT